MFAILALAALLLGGSFTPNDVLPGGPSKAAAPAIVTSPAAVDDVLPGGPS
jgi:hypothetical protein